MRNVFANSLVLVSSVLFTCAQASEQHASISSVEQRAVWADSGFSAETEANGDRYLPQKLADVDGTHRPLEKLADVDGTHRPLEKLADVDGTHRPLERLADVDGTYRPQEKSAGADGTERAHSSAGKPNSLPRHA